MADPIQYLSLCSGVGMLDIGLHAACEWLGWPCRAVGYCERDAYAAACLLARMEEQSLEPAPVWCGNLEDLDAGSLRGWANCIVAGFPCQPWSHAGRQEGTADERWLWPALFRIGLEIRPEFWFLENVPGLVSGGGLEHVLSDLAQGGWDAEWLNLTAESVGAAHRRERVFILAFRQGGRRRIVRQPSGRNGQPDGGSEATVGQSERGRRGIDQPGRGSDRRAAAGGAGEPVGQPAGIDGDERERQRISQRLEQGENPGLKDQASRWASPAGRDYRSPNGESYQDRSDSTKGEQLVNQVEHQFLPPDQRQTGDASRKCSTRRLNPAFVCWLMGVPWFWTRAEPINSAAAETAAYRSLLQQHLSNFFGEQT